MSTIVTTGLQFVQLAILARLLDPDAFGLMTMVIAVTGFARAFADMGLSNAIIQHQDVTRNQLSSLYWANVAMGGLLFVALIVGTPLIVAFYQEPQLAKVLPVAAIAFLINPLGQQFYALFQKDLRFDILSKVEIIAKTCNFGVSIIFALANSGVYALVYGQLAGSAMRVVICFFASAPATRPQLQFRFNDLRSYLNFGLYQMGERAINYFGANLDNLWIGRALGTEILGFYSIAYRLIILPLQYINPIITRVAFPTFSQVQNDDARLRSGYLRMISLLSLVVCPLSLGLAAVAPLVVQVFLGEQWLPSTGLIQILAFVGLLKALSNPAGSVMLAKGRADIGFKWNLAIALSNFIVFGFAVRWGVETLAWTYLVIMIIYFGAFQLINGRLINLSLVQYAKTLLPSLLMSLLMTSVVLILKKKLLEVAGGFSIVFQLIILVGSGTIVYSLLVFWQFRPQLMDVYRLAVAKGGDDA